MRDAETLRLDACPECGCFLEHVRDALEARDDQLAVAQEDRENLEHELRGKRSQNRRLRADQDVAMRNNPRFLEAVDVLGNWRVLCSPNARELTGKRLELCVARLTGGYTPTELKRAVWGYSLKPYVVDGRRVAEASKDRWYADATLIFRDAYHVDAGLRIAEREQDYKDVLGSGGVVQADTERRDEPQVDGLPADELSALGEAALKYARFGWLVFPCLEREKVPATRHGLDDAKRDEVAIRGAWSMHPELNVAVATGAGSGLVVLDVDGEEGQESLRALELRHEGLPTTASVKTPRGGQHFYFRHPGIDVRNTAGWPGPGLDIRGDGGYVLAPPSVGPGGRCYEVDEQATIAAMPDWLVELVSRRQRDRGRADPSEWLAMINEGVTEGQRDNEMTRLVGKMVRSALEPDLIMGFARLANERFKPPLSPAAITRIVTSITRREARK